MKNYEITFITREEPKDSSVKAILETFGGRILKTSSLGQKTLAYPIKKEKSGFYSTYIFEIDPEQVQALNRKLDMEEEVLRHLIVFIKPSQEMAGMQLKDVVNEIETKPETEIMVEPEKALEIEPEKEIEAKPTEEIEAVEEKIVEKPKKVTKKAVEKAETKVEAKEEIKETVKKEKPAKKEVKAETKGINEAVNKAVNEVVEEEERLEALDKKLEELLKE